MFGSDFERAATRSEKAAKGLKGISPGAGLAAGIAGAAILSGIKSTISAAANAQQVLGQTKVALDDAGLSWSQYGKRIETVIDAQRKLGFDDEELLKTFSLFIRRTGDVGKALDRNQLSLDVARGRYIDLADAANIVNKASLGQAGALRRIGIDAKNGSSGLQLLTLLQQKYGGAAQAAAGDATTANAKLRVSIQNVQEQLGKGLLPTVTNLADNLSTAAENATALVTALQGLDGKKGGGGIGKLFENNSLTQLVDFVKLTKSGTPVKFGETPKQTFDRLEALKEGSKLFAKQFGGGQEGSRKAGKAFGKTFGLAALEAAGKAAGNTPPPIFGKRGTFKIPAAANRKPLTAEQRNQFFDARVSRSLFRAEGLPAKQLAQLRKVAATLTQRIAITKDVTRKLNLEDQLISVNRQSKGLQDQIAQDFTGRIAKQKLVKQEAAATRLAQVTARQFRELGLGADGNAITPGVANLKKRLGNFTEAVKGTFLDTSKTQTQLARFRKVLSESLVPKDVRSKFADMLSDLEQQLKDHVNGPLTKTTQLNLNRITGGVEGLSALQRRQIQANTSHFNSAGVALSGAGSMTLNVPVSIDGKVVAKASAKYNRRTKKLNPSQRNGPNARHF